MAGLRELKKHLSSVQMTGQMAGAMKTASTAKFARLSRSLADFSAYADACAALRARLGAALAGAYPTKDPSAPPCFVVLGANRGLCGGYNLQLNEFVEAALAAEPGARLVAAGQHAIAHCRERGPASAAEFVLPDVPAAADCAALLDYLTEQFTAGVCGRVELFWQRFDNMLTQTPSRQTLLPLAAEAAAPASLLLLPDRAAAVSRAAAACLTADLTARVLEAAAGCQAATMIAMRAALENAEESAASLGADISRRRQSEVTASVIETAGQNNNR